MRYYKSIVIKQQIKDINHLTYFIYDNILYMKATSF